MCVSGEFLLGFEPWNFYCVLWRAWVQETWKKLLKSFPWVKTFSSWNVHSCYSTSEKNLTIATLIDQRILRNSFYEIIKELIKYFFKKGNVRFFTCCSCHLHLSLSLLHFMRFGVLKEMEKSFVSNRGEGCVSWRACQLPLLVTI